MTLLRLLVCFLLLCPLRLLADANIEDWIGEYSMNHDGHVGTLRIRRFPSACSVPPWCRLAIGYTDANGATFSGRIDSMDQALQHLVFFIQFPGNRQRFDAYLFSGDKDKFAGTTIWGGRTFGMFATRLGAAAPVPSAQHGTERTITADGRVVIHHPDGTIKTQRLDRLAMCDFDVTRPDGTFQPGRCAVHQDLPRADLPEPPPILMNRLQQHSDTLLKIVGLLLSTPEDLNNYRNNEGHRQIFDEIENRTQTIESSLSH